MFNFKTQLDDGEMVQVAALGDYVVCWGFGYHSCYVYIEGVRV